jgi:putative sterol carrier protein
MATLEELTEKVRSAVASGADIGKSITLDLKGEGFIHVDGDQVVNEDRPADLTVRISRRDLVAMGKRELDPMKAIMTGRLRMSDMGLALSLQPKIQALFSRLA